jgi:hypothetical protein
MFTDWRSPRQFRASAPIPSSASGKRRGSREHASEHYDQRLNALTSRRAFTYAKDAASRRVLALRSASVTSGFPGSTAHQMTASEWAASASRYSFSASFIHFCERSCGLVTNGVGAGWTNRHAVHVAARLLAANRAARNLNVRRSCQASWRSGVVAFGLAVELS